MKTKLILLPLVALFLMTACSTDPKAKARKVLEAKIVPQLNDPKSYEFVSLDFNTFLTASDSIKGANLNADLKSPRCAELAVAFVKESIRQINAKNSGTPPTAAEISSLDSLHTAYNAALKEARAGFIKSATNAKTDADVVAYSATINYRAKNMLGAVVPGSNSFLLDRDFQLIPGTHLDTLKDLSLKWDKPQ
jgi:hypothetical protein